MNALQRPAGSTALALLGAPLLAQLPTECGGFVLNDRNSVRLLNPAGVTTFQLFRV